MAQQIINIGASANDGQGDPIRTAFAKTNNNFTQLFGIGASQIIYNGTSNVNLPFLNGNVFISVGGVGNVMVIDPTGANIDGTLAVTSDVTGGNLLTGGVVSATGTITGANLIGSYIQGIVTTASQTQITELGTLTSLSVGGNISSGNMLANGDVSVTGNLTVNGNATLSGNILGDRVQNGTTSFDIQTQNGNANITVAGTSNVVVFSTTGVYVTGLISATGNATAGNVLTGGLISATGNATAGNVLTGGLISATGNATAGNLRTGGLISATGNATAGNVLTGGLISATGNITGNYILGNGSQLTGLPAPTVTQDITSNGAMSIMTYDGVIKYVNYATVEPSSGNITGGNLSATGNITGNYIFGNGSQLTGISGGSANTGNVTFNDVNIIGDGNLYLQPDPANASAYLDIFLTGGAGPDIHIAANSENVIIGRDTGANVNVNIDGKVSIQSDAGTPYTWTFDYDGNLSIPGGGSVYNVGVGTAGITANINSGNAYLGLDDTTSSVTLYGNADVQIGTNGNVSWNFDSTGNLTVPGQIVTASNSKLDLISLGANIAYLTTTTDQSTGLYLSEDVAQLFARANVTIYSNVSGAAQGWAFNADGIITLPNGGHLGNIFGITSLESAGSGAALIQNANCYVGVAPDESFTVVAASQVWTFSNANAAATLQCPVVAYAALPAATYAAGLRAFVNDSTVIAFGDPVVGGASNTVPVWSDGTVWRVG